MNNLWVLEQKRDYYLREISRMTPPRNHHDVVMIEGYQRLLGDIDFRLEIAETSKTDA